MPKVSVIIPTYNNAHYVGLAVESVLAQTFKDYQLIVVDDGSTDDTKQKLGRYKDKIIYIYQENQERSATRNNGIRVASGQYIAFLDADDIWLSEKLERQVSILDQYPSVSLVYGQAYYIDTTGERVKFRSKWIDGSKANSILIADRSEDLFLGDLVYGGGSGAMVRRSFLDQTTLFDETLSYGEDWDLWIRLSRHGPFAYVPEPLLCYRIYGWHKVLTHESADWWLEQQLTVLKKARECWQGDPEEGAKLYLLGKAEVFKRVALANLHLNQGNRGQKYLEKAIAADSRLLKRDNVLHLAVDRAKLIETETGSYAQAEAFVETFFHYLPGPVRHLRRAKNKALAWLYAGGAFESRRRQEPPSETRRLLWQAIRYTPAILTNRGVLSLAVEAGLGQKMAGKLRQLVG